MWRTDWQSVLCTWRAETFLVQPTAPAQRKSSTGTLQAKTAQQPAQLKRLSEVPGNDAGASGKEFQNKGYMTLLPNDDDDNVLYLSFTDWFLYFSAV